MWKEEQRTRKKEVLSSHHVESSRASLTTVSLEVLNKPISQETAFSNGLLNTLTVQTTPDGL